MTQMENEFSQEILNFNSGSWPWLALMGYTNNREEISWKCGKVKKEFN